MQSRNYFLSEKDGEVRVGETLAHVGYHDGPNGEEIWVAPGHVVEDHEAVKTCGPVTDSIRKAIVDWRKKCGGPE